ncbi:MBL fold metallo-hydrolase [Streptomyces massasporeus]|uniref:MBL fold metallo-hydrolase n=1 Tax=Streptomyces massasporeus TaxID=67324 RepID=UPI0033EA93DC
MSQNSGVIGDRPLNKIVMPGSHDAGSWSINPASGVCDSGFEAANAGKNPGVAAALSVTQASPIVEQLNSGSRVLDLRLCKQDGKWYPYHGGPLGNLFFDDEASGHKGEINEIAAWLRDHPEEIVTIELSLSVPPDTNPSDGTWTATQPLPGVNADLEQGVLEFGGGERAVTAMPNGELQVIAYGRDKRMYHNLRRTDGSWIGWARPNSDAVDKHFPGSPLAITGAPNGDAHLLAIGKDGYLYHTIRYANGSWQGWAAVMGPDDGRFKAKDMAITALSNGIVKVAARVRGVFLTHLHSDHVADLGTLLLFSQFDRAAPQLPPLRIFGPGRRGTLPALPAHIGRPEVVGPENPTPGTEDLVKMLLAAHATDLNDRVSDYGAPTMPLSVQDIEIPDAVPFDADESFAPPMDPFEVHRDELVTVTATLVAHPPTAPAFALRFTTAEGSVTISGDTAPCDNLVRLARETDLLLHEAIDLKAIEASSAGIPRPGVREALMAHHRRSHTTPREAGEIAAAAGAGILALHHLVPGDVPDDVWGEASETLHGPLLVPDDLDVIEFSTRDRRA